MNRCHATTLSRVLPLTKTAPRPNSPAMNRRTFLATSCFWPASASAHSSKVGTVAIGHAWALPADLGVDGQAFMPLYNSGKSDESLIAARSDICAGIELRAHNKYDILALREFYLAPGKPFAMRPTARHLRLMGLRKPLALGEKFPLVLDFLNAGEIEVIVHIENTPGD
jgi:periplasmic copper chaperone A